MNVTAWQIFEKSGRVSDYLSFKTDDIISTETAISAEANRYADKDSGNCVETTQCR